jgi:hypothetical protein
MNHTGTNDRVIDKIKFLSQMYALKLPIKNHSKQIFGPPEQRLLPGPVGWSWLSGAAKNEMENLAGNWWESSTQRNFLLNLRYKVTMI